MYEKLPQKLKETGLFCAYRNEQRGGRKTKVPYNMRTPSRAHCNSRESFCDFATALRHVSKYDGLGVGVFDGLCAIDLDRCVQPDKTLTALAADVVETMDSYTEYSPSGTGLRILFSADGFAYDKARYYDLIAKKPKAALIAYRALVSQFPHSDWTGLAQIRIDALSKLVPPDPVEVEAPGNGKEDGT